MPKLNHGQAPRERGAELKSGILAILSGGLNERFSGGLFGNGTYLAEARVDLIGGKGQSVRCQQHTQWLLKGTQQQST